MLVSGSRSAKCRSSAVIWALASISTPKARMTSMAMELSTTYWKTVLKRSLSLRSTWPISRIRLPASTERPWAPQASVKR